MKQMMIVCAGLLSLCAAPASPSGSNAAGTYATYHTRLYVTLADLPLDTLADSASEIVHARVLDRRADFPSNAWANTAYTLEVLSAIKGWSSNRMTVRIAGARDDTRWLEVPSAPTFEIGEEVVLFVDDWPETQSKQVLGLAKGTYRVRRDAAGQARVIGVHAADVPLTKFLDDTSNAWARAEARKQR
jgi:hypothetical protein